VAGVTEATGLAVVEPEDTPVVSGTKNSWGNEAVCMSLLHYFEIMHLGYS
jgi:hypothetical protein